MPPVVVVPRLNEPAALAVAEEPPFDVTKVLPLFAPVPPETVLVPPEVPFSLADSDEPQPIKTSAPTPIHPRFFMSIPFTRSDAPEG